MKEENKKIAFMLASPIISACTISLIIIMLLFIACGWFFVATIFVIAASSAIAGIAGLVFACINIPNGLGAVLMSAGIGFIGIGFTVPLFLLAKDFYYNYRALNHEILNKIKNIKNKILGR